MRGRDTLIGSKATAQSVGFAGHDIECSPQETPRYIHVLINCYLELLYTEVLVFQCCGLMLGGCLLVDPSKVLCLL